MWIYFDVMPPMLLKLYPKLGIAVGGGEGSLQEGDCSRQLPDLLMQWTISVQELSDWDCRCD